MNSFELNKILGAILGTSLVMLALNILAGAIFSPETPSKAGYVVAVKEAPAEKEKEPAPAAAVPIEQLLADASIERGETAAKKCAACHTFQKGGPNRVGPNLWAIVGRPKGSHEGFNYSAALKGMGGEWTIADLDKFLMNPKGMVPGTAMSFAGLTRDRERADVLAYLNSLADNPAPLPKAAAAPSPSGTPGQAPKQ